jgi:hypothetical protein
MAAQEHNCEALLDSINQTYSHFRDLMDLYRQVLSSDDMSQLNFESMYGNACYLRAKHSSLMDNYILTHVYGEITDCATYSRVICSSDDDEAILTQKLTIKHFVERIEVQNLTQ